MERRHRVGGLYLRIFALLRKATGLLNFAPVDALNSYYQQGII
jgi:hypothetical protein